MLRISYTVMPAVVSSTFHDTSRRFCIISGSRQILANNVKMKLILKSTSLKDSAIENVRIDRDSDRMDVLLNLLPYGCIWLPASAPQKMSALIKSCRYSFHNPLDCEVMHHNSFKIQKPKFKNRKMISHVGCKWFDGPENSLERLINIEHNDAGQTLIFYWLDNQERRHIAIENIIMPYETIHPDRVVLRIRTPPVNAIDYVELRFPTPNTLDQFIVYITPESSDSGNSSPSSDSLE